MRRRAGGFTIIEVLMAVALMAIALSGIAMTGVVSMRADTKSHRASAATSLAQAKLEQLRNTERDAAAWSEGAHEEGSLDEHGATAVNGLYTRRWTVDLGYNGQTDLARVTVNVSWPDGGPQAVVLSALYW